jgi:hypothetical protein
MAKSPGFTLFEWARQQRKVAEDLALSLSLQWFVQSSWREECSVRLNSVLCFECVLRHLKLDAQSVHSVNELHPFHFQQIELSQKLPPRSANEGAWLHTVAAVGTVKWNMRGELRLHKTGPLTKTDWPQTHPESDALSNLLT